MIGGDSRAARSHWPPGYEVDHIGHLSPSDGKRLDSYDLVVVLVKFTDQVSMQRVRTLVPSQRRLLFKQSTYELAKQLPSLLAPGKIVPAEPEPPDPARDWRVCPGKGKAHLWCKAAEVTSDPPDPTTLEIEPCRQHLAEAQVTAPVPVPTAPAPVPRDGAQRKVEALKNRRPWSDDELEALKIAIREHGTDAARVVEAFHTLSPQSHRTPLSMESVLVRRGLGADGVSYALRKLQVHGLAGAEAAPSPPPPAPAPPAPSQETTPEKWPAPPALKAPTGTARESRERLTAMLYALRRLAKSERWTRSYELFDHATHWTHRALKRLREYGLIETRGKVRGTEHRALDREALLDWAHKGPEPLWSETEPPTVGPPATPPPPAVPAGHLLTEGPPKGHDEVQEAILKLLAASIEAIQRLEQKVDHLMTERKGQ